MGSMGTFYKYFVAHQYERNISENSIFYDRSYSIFNLKNFNLPRPVQNHFPLFRLCHERTVNKTLTHLTRAPIVINSDHRVGFFGFLSVTTNSNKTSFTLNIADRL